MKIYVIVILVVIASFTFYFKTSPLKLQSNLIEYYPGNIPLIISVPHDGIVSPHQAITRTLGNVIYDRDANTSKVASSMYKIMKNKYHKYPHVIINKIHRMNVDMNRSLKGACNGGEVNEAYWHLYHNKIKQIRKDCLSKFGKVL